MTPLEGALIALDKGFTVVPLRPNSKLPAIPNWTKEGFSNASQVQAYADAHPTANWGVSTGASNLCVIDIDTKEGKSGRDSFEALQLKYGKFPETLTVKTPTGGVHLYYSGLTKSGASVLGKDIDTRSIGGQAAWAGSSIDGKPYRIIRDLPIAELPQWVFGLVKQQTEPVVLDEHIGAPEGKRNTVLASLAGTMRSRGMSSEAIEAALLVVNDEQFATPLSSSEVRSIVRSIARYQPQQAIAVSEFVGLAEMTALDLRYTNAIDIPKREWIMEKVYIPRFITVLFAAGAVGKSSLTVLDALSICTGKPLSGFAVHQRGGVWLYNTEDPLDESLRRVHACCIQHGIDPKDVHDLYMTSGRDNPLVVAKGMKETAVIIEESIDRAVTFIRKHAIKLFVADPFVRTHQCNENDNNQIDLVVRAFQKIADMTGCAVCLVHHTSKAGAMSADGEDVNGARGASALACAARIAHSILTMTKEEAPKLGVPVDRRRFYFRRTDAKNNLIPPIEHSDWYEKCGTPLPNGDIIGTVTLATEIRHMAEIRKQHGEVLDHKDWVEFLTALLPNSGDAMEGVEIRKVAEEKAPHLFTSNASRFYEALKKLHGEQFDIEVVKRSLRVVRK